MHSAKAVQGDQKVDYTDARRDTGTKTVQMRSHLTVELSLRLYNPAGPGGGRGRRSRLERKAVPGKECSSLEQGQGGERKGKVSLPGAKPATIFKPAPLCVPTADTRTHTHTHTHTRTRAHTLQIATRHRPE